MNKFIYILFFTAFGFSQNDTVKVAIDSATVAIDTTNFEAFNNVISNEKALTATFDKLYQLEENQDRKFRIVHIGDSHIQADIFTAKIRYRMQQNFGNAGFGFTFPYSLASTNNSSPIKFNSSSGFSATRNLYAEVSKPVGISGISFEPKQKNFHIDLLVKDAQFDFTKLKVISPKNENIFNVSFAKKSNIVQEKVAVKTPAISAHKVKPGEVLGGIADKYNISLKQLKSANGLSSDNIRDGKILKIPGGKTVTTYKTISTVKYSYEPIVLENTSLYNVYSSERPIDKITIIGNENSTEYALNGLILENENPGITYSSIGVNGAKSSDFNKFPLFFDQLPSLEADLYIISLGTNESFDKQDIGTYFGNLKTMIDGIKQKCPEASFLLTTPPPSVLHGKSQNIYIEKYAEKIIEMAPAENYAVWNLLDIFGGNKNITINSKMGLMARDKVHYSNTGYDKQGELFFDAFIQSYELFKSEK
ncbi:GDSL-type esterase/lipase family protein [Flavobacterium sp.]|jgi:LysM repeat protein|uniref:GDSL-type esterase/lipase family protein n=1 Tax=Flavobacterium sp. TaxID=239 RepID=UPI0037BF7AF1